MFRVKQLNSTIHNCVLCTVSFPSHVDSSHIVESSFVFGFLMYCNNNKLSMYSWLTLCSQVVGQDRTTGMKDRGKLPFTEAAILEIHRLGSIGEC